LKRYERPSRQPGQGLGVGLLDRPSGQEREVADLTSAAKLSRVSRARLTKALRHALPAGTEGSGLDSRRQTRQPCFTLPRLRYLTRATRLCGRSRGNTTYHRAATISDLPSAATREPFRMPPPDCTDLRLDSGCPVMYACCPLEAIWTSLSRGTQVGTSSLHCECDLRVRSNPRYRRNTATGYLSDPKVSRRVSTLNSVSVERPNAS